MEQNIQQLFQSALSSDFINASANIIAAIIQAGGTILAAVIAALFAKDIVKKDIAPHFRTYKDSPRSLMNVIREARHDVIVVVVVGDNLLKEYLNVFSELLKRNIYIRFLLLDENGFLKMEEYMHGEWKNGVQIRNDTVSMLAKLASNYIHSFEVRVFSNILTASYIGVDIQEKILPSSIIQEMVYLYKTKASDCPITYISPKNDEIAFESTVKAIGKMWDASEPVYFSES